MSAPAGATLDQTLVNLVQTEFTRADAEGKRRPGRARIMDQFGVTESQARQVIAAVTALDQHTPDLDQTWTRPGPAGATAGPVWPARLPRAQVLPMPDRGEPTVEIPRLGLTDPDDIAELEELWSSPGPENPRPTTSTNTTAYPKSWPLMLIGLAGALTVWSGWVQLGHMTGFGVVQLLPGIADRFTIDAAILLPLGIEFYGGYAIRVWLSAADLSPRTISFARWSSLSSLAVGAGAQVAAHLLIAAGRTSAPWQITTLVACIPVALVGLAAGLARLVANDRAAAGGSA